AIRVGRTVRALEHELRFPTLERRPRQAILVPGDVLHLEAEVLVERDRALDIDDPHERDELADAVLRLLHDPGHGSATCQAVPRSKPGPARAAARGGPCRSLRRAASSPRAGGSARAGGRGARPGEALPLLNLSRGPPCGHRRPALWRR